MIARLQHSLKEKDKGFTLVELLVVIVIVGILAGIAIPLFLNQRQKAADAAAKSDLKNAATVFETAFVDDQTYANVADTDLQESENVTLDIVVQDASTFCVNGSHSGGELDFYYDSASGGLLEGSCTAPTTTP